MARSSGEALKRVATCSATPATLLQVRSIRLCPASRALFIRALRREPGMLVPGLRVVAVVVDRCQEQLQLNPREASPQNAFNGKALFPEAL